MGKKITNNIKDLSSGDWVEFWTEKNNKIYLNEDNVKISGKSINISELSNEIMNSNNIFWKKVSNDNAGYAPTGSNSSFLYIDTDGTSKWVQPKYQKVTYTPTVNCTTAQEQQDSSTEYKIVRNREPNSTDHVLDLTNFLYGRVEVILTQNTTDQNLSIPGENQL